jgi:hypothetical protein
MARSGILPAGMAMPGPRWRRSWPGLSVPGLLPWLCDRRIAAVRFSIAIGLMLLGMLASGTAACFSN